MSIVTTSDAEFTVSSEVEQGYGAGVSVAGHADGSFLVAWVAQTPPLNEDQEFDLDVLARSFVGSSPTSATFTVNTEQHDPQVSPDVAALPGGGYVVAYSSGDEDHLPGTFAASQQITASGAKDGAEQFGDYSYYHYYPDVAVAPDGRYVVVSGEETEGEAQVHAADGTITSVGRFGYTDSVQEATAALGGSSYLVAWHGASGDQDPDTGDYGTFGLWAETRSFDGAAGQPFLVAQTTVNAVDPSIAVLGDGRAVLAWSDAGELRFSLVDAANGTATAPTDVTSQGGASHQTVAVLADGNFVVAWTDGTGADGSGSGIEARVFHADGTAAGAAFVVDQQTAGDQTNASVAAVGGNSFVVAWQGPNGVEARILNDQGAGVSSGDPLFSRTGTVDLSPAANQSVAGAATANSFFVDNQHFSGADRLTSFGKADVLLTTVALADGNHDGIVNFGRNGTLDLGGADGGTIRIDSTRSLRLLGQEDGRFVYAQAGVRPHDAIEGTLGNDMLKGDAAGTHADSFFFDTALGTSFGHDGIANFGASDILVTTTKIVDTNSDGIISFGANGILDLGNGTQVGIEAMGGHALTSLEYDGTVQHNGVSYFIYSGVGSAASTSSLRF